MKIILVFGLHFIVIILTCYVEDEQSTYQKKSRPEACGPHGVCKCGPTHKYYQVNCRKRSCKVVPRHILPNATKIVLSENALEYIPEDVFANTPIVTLINLTDNNLTTLPSKLFARTVFLKSLLIASNNLKELPPGFLANTPELEYINLSSNKLTSVPADFFKDKHNLSVIVLMKNNLQQLPPTMLSSTPNIRILFLGTNKIRKIPDGFFDHTPNLDYLSMPVNNIKNVTQSTFAGVRSLIYLSFAWNDLSRLPSDAFGGLHLNGSLDLSHNKLKEIPRGLFQAKNMSHPLTMLYLQGNNLTFLRSESFAGLYRLKYIFLNNNNISWLESDVFEGTNVGYIYLFGNNLRHLSNNSFRNRNIKEIYLFGNNLRHLSNNSFRNRNLREIHLYENEIRSISQSALKGMSNKLKIFLNCKNLNHIPWSENFINMSCVNEDFVPNITFKKSDTKLKLTLQKEGFVCKKHRNWTTCSPCPPGSYGNGHGNCVSCARGGFYQDKIGMKKCKTCVDGTFVNYTNASNFAQCTLCPEGTNQTQLAGYRACFCKANYSRTNRFMGCSLCEDNGVNCSLDYKFLRPGFYWNWSFPLTNITAYAQFVANLQTNSSLYDLDSIEYNHLMPYAHDCPNDFSCLNNNSHTVGGLNGTCAKGYRGWMCYQCENYYYRVLNSCKQCPGHWWIISETITVFVIICGAFYFLISQSKEKEKELKSGYRSLLDKVTSRLKIVLGFYQVVGELFESLHDINWVGPLSSVGRLLSFRNINVFSLFVRPRCLNSNFVFDSKLKFKIALMFPLFVLMTAILIYIVGKLILLRKFRGNRSELTHHLVKLKCKIYYYILLLLFVTYTPSCVAIFAFYPKACQQFWVYQGRNDTISLLRSDFDVKCDNGLEPYRAAAYVGTIFYVITFPVVLLYLLNKFGKEGDVRGEDNATEDDTIYQERTSLLSHSEVTIPFWIKFICENYKPRFWYWEVVELARKATQTAIVTLLGWDDKLTILSTIGLSVLFLTLHAKFSPFKSSFEQRLQLFSLTAIFINVLIVAVDIPHEYGELVSTPLILLNLIIIVTITGEMALGLIRFVRDKYFRH